MKRALLLLSLFAVLSICTSPVLALTQSFSGSIRLTSTDWTDTLTFPKFDPSLGILTQVEIQLSGTMNTILDIQNMSATGKSSSGHGIVDVIISTTVPGSLLTQSVNLASVPFLYSLAAGQSTTSGLLTDSDVSNAAYNAAGILAAFTGTGTVDLTINAGSTMTLVNKGGPTMIGETTNAGAGATVIYTYVPEPTTVGLLSLGAFAIIRKKK